MKLTTIDGNGKSTNVDFTLKKVLCKPLRKQYGWAIKPDTRAKHPSNVRPHIEEVIELEKAPQVGQVIFAQYTSSF